MSCVSHAEPPNVSYDEKVKIGNDGEFYTVTVNFSVSHHTICFSLISYVYLVFLFRETLRVYVPIHSNF